MLSNKGKEILSIWRSGWLSMLLWIVVHRDSKPGQHRICRGTKRNFKSPFEEIKCSTFNIILQINPFCGKRIWFYRLTPFQNSQSHSRKWQQVMNIKLSQMSQLSKSHKCHNCHKYHNYQRVTNITNVANIKKQCIILVDHSLFLVSLLWHLLTGPPMTYYDLVLLTHWILFVGQNSYYYEI